MNNLTYNGQPINQRDDLLPPSKEDHAPFAWARLDYLYKYIQWDEQREPNSPCAWGLGMEDPNFELEPECYVIKIGGSEKISDHALPLRDIDKVMPDGYSLYNFPSAVAAVAYWEEKFYEGRDLLLLELCIKEFSNKEIAVSYRLLEPRKALAELDEFAEFVTFEQAKDAASAAASKRLARRQEESDFESSLMAFLDNRGVNAIRQVSTGNQRLDVLIPGQLIIELKAGKVTGDDMCQAIDYLVTHRMDVLMVGTGLTSSATRAMEAINRISDQAQVLFVTKNACFHYLEAVVCKTKN